MAEKSWRFLVFLLQFVLVLLVMLAWFQRSLIYYPTKSNSLDAAGSSVAQSVVNVHVTTSDHLVLNGWLAMAGQRRTVVPNVPAHLAQGRPLAIVFPGNGGNRSNRDYLIQVLGSQGADVLIFDYRGFGDNPGKPTEAHLTRDARAIWKYATEELKVPANRIVLYGESLGAGVAVHLAADLCTENIEPGGLVVQSSFNSLVAAGQHHFPILPVNLLLIDRFESEKYIPRVTCPILQLHGERDVVVPLPLGKKLFEAAPEKTASGIPKQMVLLPRTNHNDVYGPDVKQAVDAVGRFLDGVQTRAKPPKVLPK